MTPSRSKGAGIGLGILLLVLSGVRLLAVLQDDDPSGPPSLPPRDVGESVPGVELSAAETCALLTPADLRRIYGERFDAGETTTPTATDTTPATGEPSEAPLTEIAGCAWSATGVPLEVSVTSFPPLAADDANATYELIRPDSPSQAFDSTSEVGDEAFFYVGASDPGPNRSDRMVVRSGGVILQISATGDTEPAGGLDALAEVARQAVADLPPQG